jgi:hypothetical protein
VARVVVPGVPTETMLRDRQAAASEEWPFSLGVVVCPDCESIITVERSTGWDVLIADTQGYAETVDAYLRCPNCWLDIGYNIDLSRRRRWVRHGWRFSRDWVTAVESMRR